MKTILLADDAADLRSLVRATLAHSSYRVLEAGDGVSALQLARQEHPDLVVLDWMMPRMSGIQVAEALSADPVTASIPVIMLTGQRSAEDKKVMEALALHSYLLKPFSPLELLRRVRSVLG